MKITIEDPWLGKREVDDLFVGIIRDQLKLLELWLNDGSERTPEQIDHLKYDIAVYRFILESQDPEVAAEQYFKTKRELATWSKREVAEHLGWKIEVRP